VRVNFEENLVKVGQILRRLRTLNRRSMSLELKLKISKNILTLTLTFFSYVFFFFTFSSPRSLSPLLYVLLHLLLNLVASSSSSLPSPLNLRVVPLLFSLVFICISRGVTSHWFSFTFLLFIDFSRVRDASFLASSTFVWCAQASWWFRLNAGSTPLASSLCKRLAIL